MPISIGDLQGSISLEDTFTDALNVVGKAINEVETRVQSAQAPIAQFEQAFNSMGMQANASITPLNQTNEAFAAWMNSANNAISPANQASEAFGKLGHSVGDGTKPVQESVGYFQNLFNVMSEGGGSLRFLGEGIADFVGNPLQGLKNGLLAGLESMGGFGLAVAGMAAAVGAIGYVFLEAAKQVFAFAAASAKFGGEINDMGEKMSLSSERTSKLAYAFDVAGGSIQQASSLISMMQRRMADSPDAFEKGLAAIGLSMSQLINLQPDEQLYAIAKAFQENTNQTNRASASMEIFGRAGRDSIPQLMKPLQELSEETSRYGVVLSDEATAASEKFEMAQKRLEKQFEAVNVSLGQHLVPSFTTLMGVTSDTIVAVQQLGSVFTWLIEHDPVVTQQIKWMAEAYEWLAKSARGGKDAVETHTAALDANQKQLALEVAAAEGWVKGLSASTLKGMQAASAADTLTAGLAALGIVQGESIDLADLMGESQKKSAEAIKKTTEVTQSSIGQTAALWDEYFSLVEKGRGDDVAASLKSIDKWYDGEKAGLEKSKKSNLDYWNKLAALDALSVQKRVDIQKTYVDKIVAIADDASKASQAAWEKEQDKKVSINEAGFMALYKAQEDYTDFVKKQSLSAVEYEIQQIDRWVESQLNAFPIGAAGLEEYTAAIREMGNARKDALDAVSDGMNIMSAADYELQHSMIDLNKTVATTHAQFVNALDGWASSLTQLATVSGDTFGGIIKDIAQVVVSWNAALKAYDAYREASKNNDRAGQGLAIAQSGVAVAAATGSGSTAARTTGGALAGAGAGATIGMAFAPETMGASIAVGAIAGALVGLYRGWQENNMVKKVNDLRDAFQEANFAGSFSAMNTAAHEAGLTLDRLLNAKTIEEYTAAQNELTQALQHHKDVISSAGAFGPSQTQMQDMSDMAREVYEYMLHAGTYSAEQVQAAWEESAHAAALALGDAAAVGTDAAKAAGFHTRAELEATAKKAKDTYEFMRDSGLYTAAEIKKAWDATIEAQGMAYDDATASIKDLVSQYDTLAQSVAGEAPEEVMGVIEAATRAQMAVLKEQGEKQLELSGQNADEAARHWEEALGSLHPQPVHIPIIWDVPALPTGAPTEAPEPTAEAEGTHGIAYASGPQTFSTQGNEFFQFGGENKGLSDFGSAAPDNSDLADSIDGLRGDLLYQLPRAIGRSLRDAMQEANA